MMEKFWIIGLLILVWACKPTTNIPIEGLPSLVNYQENLTSTLPDFPDFRQVGKVPVQEVLSSSLSVDDELASLRNKIYEKNKSEPFFSGFTVLIYSGIDRSIAFKTRDDLSLYFPDYSPDMLYQQPRYLVKVGQYAYKLEAQRVFSRVKSVFPSARIIQDRFQRKEYVPPLTYDPNAPAKN